MYLRWIYWPVRKAIENHGGKLTYDAISDMKYLEACILGEF